MADSERNPKLDPKPGDVLRYPSSVIADKRRVYAVSRVGRGYRVGYDLGGSLMPHHCSLEDWRKWASTATVVSRAE